MIIKFKIMQIFQVTLLSPYKIVLWVIFLLCQNNWKFISSITLMIAERTQESVQVIQAKVMMLTMSGIFNWPVWTGFNVNNALVFILFQIRLVFNSFSTLWALPSTLF